MRSLATKTNLRKAGERVSKEIRNFATGGGIYAAGLASEGYNGGYQTALQDVLLAMNGVRPDTRFWDEIREN